MNAYDDLPYASKINRARHIDALGTMARLYGYLPADPFGARVLEIGCSTGDALFPLAFEYPQATFVGIDTSSSQIKEALERKKYFKEHKLDNLEFIHGDVTVEALKGRRFDYIICHGVLSWISKEDRSEILKSIPSLLSDKGVCFLSYNCAPGGLLRKAIWDGLKKFVTAHSSDLVEIRKAITAFQETIEIDYEKPYQLFVYQELDRILKEPDQYLVHEVFALQNEPLYFNQLVEDLSGHALKIIGDVRPHRTGLQRFLSAHLAASSYTALSQLQTHFNFSAESISDFCFGTPFRESLIMKNLQEGSPHLSKELFHSLSFSHTGIGIDEKSSSVEKLLLDHYPHFLTFSDLTSSDANALHGLDNEKVSADLMHCFIQDRIVVSFYPPEVSSKVYAFPKTSPWIQDQASRQEIVTNLQYRSIELDSLARGLLAHLDGKTSREELETVAHQMVKSGEGGIKENGQLVEDPIHVASLIPELVESALETLKKAAMLLP
jgi:SAM-dependent methyltransferase